MLGPFRSKIIFNIEIKKITIIFILAIMILIIPVSGCTDEEVKSQSVIAEILYETIEETDDNLAPGVRRVKVEGENGFKRVTYEVNVVDGKETSKKIVNEKVIKKPVDEVVVVGPVR